LRQHQEMLERYHELYTSSTTVLPGWLGAALGKGAGPLALGTCSGNGAVAWPLIHVLVAQPMEVLGPGLGPTGFDTASGHPTSGGNYPL
jgi:hypothetical protein